MTCAAAMLVNCLFMYMFMYMSKDPFTHSTALSSSNTVAVNSAATMLDEDNEILF